MRSSRGRYRISRSSRASRSANPTTRYYRPQNSGFSSTNRGSNDSERGRNSRRPRRYSSRYRSSQARSSRFDDGRLTPYQGYKRVYGYFRCDECGRTWSSGNSWADCGQMCLSCNINVYPYHQTMLTGQVQSSKSEGPEKAHKTGLCEKCRKLGYSCLKYLEELKKKKYLMKNDYQEF